MTDAKTMWSLLGEYGISTVAELEDAIRRMKKIDIGVFAAPVMKRNERDEESDSIGVHDNHIEWNVSSNYDQRTDGNRSVAH